MLGIAALLAVVLALNVVPGWGALLLMAGIGFSASPAPRATCWCAAPPPPASGRRLMGIRRVRLCRLTPGWPRHH